MQIMLWSSKIYLNTQASLSDQLTGDAKPKVRPSRIIPEKVKNSL